MRRHLLGLLFAVTALLAAPAARGDEGGRCWVATWGAAVQAPLFAPAATFQNQTLRQIVHISVGGRAVRVRFSNAIGSLPLTIDAASVGVRLTGANIVPGTLKPLTFGGVSSITIPPHAVAVSDPVALRIEAQTDLAISLFVENATATTQLTLAHQTSYLSGTGDFTGSANLSPASTFTSWYFLAGVEVKARNGTGTVVAFGDSITEGFGSTTDANARWPDVLARRLLERRIRLAVANMAISGNRVLNDEIGPNAQSRFDSEALTVTGARHIILLEGINDIGFSQIAPGVFPPHVLLTNVSADDIIAGYKQLIRRAHAQGIRIYGATLLAFVGAGYQDEAAEVKRQAVNHWIRTAGAFDAVIDFDAATRDPNDPTRLNPGFDSGDHLHPNDAGFEAMGNAVPLWIFWGDGGRRDDCD